MEQEFHTLEEALACLTPQEQAHARRVAAYCETAFAQAVAMDLYISESRGSRELIPEHKPLARLCGLYHDLGKLSGEEGHAATGGDLFVRLDPQWKRRKAVEQRMLLGGIRDHHRPQEGETQEDVSYMGRIVAIADRLDHLAMAQLSEDPVAQALDKLREDVAAERLDPEFYRAFRGARARLRRIFDRDREGSAALPTTQPWIRRRAGRPMGLWFRRSGKGWQTRMTFHHGKEHKTYEQVRRLINAGRLGPQLGEYFLYEACDAIHRFENCGIPCDHIAVEVPEGWLSRRGMKNRILTILADEGLPPDRIILVPAQESASKTEAENRNGCREAGVRWMSAQELEAFAAPSGEFAPEDDVVRLALDEKSGVVT